MFFSLREFLWGNLFREIFPPEQLTGFEVLVATVIAAVLLVVVYFVIRIPFFRVVRRVQAARRSAMLVGMALAVFWLVSSLELVGIYSTVIMVILFSASFAGTLAYLFLKR